MRNDTSAPILCMAVFLAVLAVEAVFRGQAVKMQTDKLDKPITFAEQTF